MEIMGSSLSNNKIILVGDCKSGKTSFLNLLRKKLEFNIKDRNMNITNTIIIDNPLINQKDEYRSTLGVEVTPIRLDNGRIYSFWDCSGEDGEYGGLCEDIIFKQVWQLYFMMLMIKKVIKTLINILKISKK